MKFRYSTETNSAIKGIQYKNIRKKYLGIWERNSVQILKKKKKCPNSMNFLHNSIDSLNKQSLKNITNDFNDEITLYHLISYICNGT